MKNFCAAFLFGSLCLLMSSTNVFAVAMGPYIDLSSGSGDFEYDYSVTTSDIDTGAFAIGFALDTAPTDENSFNYRLNVGLSRENIEDSSGYTFELSGLQVENVFGFSLMRKDDFRWWMGPSVGIGFYGGESEDGAADVNLTQFSLGGATGLNFKINENVIIAPSLGFRITGAAGTVEEGPYKSDFSAGFTMAFINVSILFE
jgi:hypothetical protein